MKEISIDHILNRAVAAPFYRRHAGLFLFLFLILFGIQPTIKNAIDTHYQLMIGILTSAQFYGLAVAVWMAYAIKVMLYFSGSVVKKPAFDFLYNLNAVAIAERGRHLLKLAAHLLLPVWIYGILTVAIGLIKHHYSSAALVLATLLLLTALVTTVFFILLKRGKGGQQVSIIFKINLPSNLFFFLFRSLFSIQFPAVMIVKTLSFFCLYAFTLTDATVFEDRILWMLFLIAMIGHSVIVFRSFHFLERELKFYRNLPLARIRILLSLLLLYTVLLLPEAWALRALLTTWQETGIYFSMIATGPVLLLLFHALLLTEDMKMEEFLKLLFGIGIVSLFASFADQHWILPAAAFVSGCFIFFTSFYSYEKTAAVEGLE